jgi:hypothetical protein
VNVHRDSVKDDCASCHSETTFKGTAFDHAAKTTFALEGRHEGLACVTCHKGISAADAPLARRVLDFGGTQSECVACHLEKDPHKGEYGRACDACHRPSTFDAKGFQHPREPAFFAGQHAGVACQKCHVPDHAARPARATAPSMACVTCHADVHLGQLGNACDACHSVDAARFAATGFSHERARFTLTGAHLKAECSKCHVSDTRAYPARSGTAILFKPMPQSCVSCHKDPHLGQVDERCETCHDTGSFRIETFVHRGLEDFFRGFHGRYGCKDCHKQERDAYPAGVGVAVKFKVGRTCAACHPNY